ncbi:MAG: SusC/RagA family TonB-linked outer membrane protein [Candidatus Pedobacter colombiensis]|uniref:SusC/RagA family TonB-linked outer membrane protein n=1 Tax=Candidatus Pedobacter colombiensis TaxID=3121371 RepID=A0AAJ6B7Y5_9SPHI|nr:SusC/RagA family TonB-linked outer membrane protein [Pedobacter sp.]WEK19966.1 MAG: SusC/RagA family TonB-linked outer membrane protein [Pedobacter sp.]
MKLSYTFILLAFCTFAVQAQKPVKVAAQKSVVPSFTKIKGTIIDIQTKKTLSKISISLKDIRTTTAETNVNGEFEIKVPSLYAVLVVSYPGYQTKEVPLIGKREINVALVKDGINLGESVVNLPYFSQSENSLNGAYAVVATTQDKTAENRSVFQMLQGTVAGLQSTSFSGVPDEGVLFDIRGIHSLYATNNPLLVVDGFPIVKTLYESAIIKGNIYNFLADINVKDIESITILKDAAAVGVYGSRASNGAIVIQTRSGTSGKTFLDFNGQLSVAERFKEIPVMDASSYRNYLSDRLYGQGYDEATISQKYPFFTNTNTQTSEYWRYANNTDWQKEISRVALAQDYHLGLRGGDGTSQYLFSIGYKDQEGTIRGTDVSRINTRFNLDFKLLKKLSVGTRVYYSRTNKNLMDQGVEERTNPLYLSLVKSPILAPYRKNNEGVNLAAYDSGTFDGLSNPLAVTNLASNQMNTNWLLGNVFLNYDFNSAFKTKVNMGLDWKNIDVNRFLPSAGIVLSKEGYIRSSEQQLAKETNIWVEHTLTYEKSFNYIHHLRAYGGYNLQNTKLNSYYGYTVNSPSDDFTGLKDGTKVKLGGEGMTIHNMSAFGNVDYEFKNKLTFTAGARLDGSSRFGKNADVGLRIFSSPTAVMPYGGIAWKISSEPWMQNLKAVDELKLRVSAGVTANQDIDPRLSQSLYEARYYVNGPGLIPSNLSNNTIKWETNYNYNAGFDLSLLSRTIRLKFDYFQNKTTDLLTPVALDGASGSTFYWTNGGSLRNNGVEAGIDVTGHAGKVNWNFGFNIATNKNRITSLPNGKPLISGYYGYKSIAMVGKPAGLFYGYKSLGVFTNQTDAAAANLIGDKGQKFKAGDFHYDDLNKDGYISEADMQVIGDPNPDFYGGATAGVSYKNFDLNAVFSYSYGNDVMNVLRSKLEVAKGYENQSIAVLTAWKENGDQTNIPKSQYGDPMNNSRPSSNWVEDGSYFKLRTLTLAYNINRKLSFIRNAKVYLSAYNVFTVTNYLGWDPEVRTGTSVFTNGYDFGNVPQSRTFLLGIKLGL